ncbi:MAG: electron transfer flavoprotein subunit beta/FixA family protein [Lachnospiraceae bacterium]|nr:electron transfer flavoprotein subunit beta/FixA family protein [Lachnospiraceae bacterium]
MNIVVCVKQVPGTTAVQVDPVTGVLLRDGASSKLNPYDLFALEAAFRLKESAPEPEDVAIRTVSMGPPQAVSSLLETVYMGADKAYLISDRVFAGSDVQATSYALSCGIARTGPFDLILCGKQTTDGDTAQVGPELAESLGIEHASGVLSIDGITEESVTVTVNLDRVLQKQEMRLPCLLTIEKDAFTPRLPSFRRKFATGDDAVSVLTADDLPELDRTRCGLKGSPTQAEKIFPPEIKKDKKLFEGDGQTLAASLYGLLSSEKYL